MDPFGAERLGARGPVLRNFLAALIKWEEHYDALGPHKAVGHWRLPRRRRLLNRALDELELLAYQIGSYRNQNVIIRFQRQVTGRITGRQETISFPPGDYVVSFQSQPVIDHQQPFALMLRFTMSRRSYIGEITVTAHPGDIHSLYELRLS